MRLGKPFLVFILPLSFFFCGPNPSKEPVAGETLSPFLIPEASPPNDILLITVDTWRHDSAGFAGHSRLQTPTLDRLASEGIVFENAYAHATVTLPSHASLLTGLIPNHHGLRDNAGYRLPPSTPTLAGYLKKHGYQTGAFISAFPLDSRFGLAHDFDHYDDRIDRYADPLAKVTERPGEVTLKLAKKWLSQSSNAPRFTWVHLYEPHYPYQAPEPFGSAYAAEPYLGEIAYVDALLADFLAPFLEGEHPATILLTSDHGEALGDHGESTHGLFAYDATLKIPLILWSPSILKAGRFKSRVGQIDLLPSLMDLHGHPIPKPVDGRSLFQSGPTPAIYFESLSTYLNRGWAPLRGCIIDNHKAIQLPIPELYDLINDPFELQNLAPTMAKKAESCLTCLPGEVLKASEQRSFSSEEQEKLAALGYTAMSGNVRLEGLASDPKNLVLVDQEIYLAFGLAIKGEFEPAILHLEKLIKAHPEVELAYQYASDYAYQAGQLERAIHFLDLAFQRGVASEMSQRKLALYLIQAGKLKVAEDILGLWRDSKDPETHSARGKLLTNKRQFAAAEQAFQEALSLDATNPSVWAEMGTMYLFSQEPAKAKAAFSKALEENDRSADAWNGLGVLQAQAGDFDSALVSWNRALDINPNMAFCHRNLANIYLRRGENEKAKMHLARYAELVTGDARDAALEQLKKIP